MKTVSRDEFVALLQSRGSAKLRDHLPRFDLDMILRGGAGTISGNLDHYRFQVQGVAILPQIDTTVLVLGGEGNQEAVRLDSTSRATATSGRPRNGSAMLSGASSAMLRAISGARRISA